MNKLIKFNLILLIITIAKKINCNNLPAFHDLTNIPINDHDSNNTDLNKNINISDFQLNQLINSTDLINHTQVTNHTESKCELITLPMCKGIGYNHTKMPNQLNHDTQEEAGLEVHQFWPLVEINCSEDLRLFLCLIYAPVCMEDFNEYVPPCRSQCERAKKGCEPVMLSYKFQWPKTMNCDKFPVHSKESICIDKKIQSNTLNQGNELTDLDNSMFNLGNIPIIEDKSKDDDENLINKKNSITGTVFDIYSEHTDDHSIQKKKKNKQRTKTYQKPSISKNDDLIDNKQDIFISPNCKCECRPPFIPINHLNDKRYFNQIITGGQINCASPCHSPYFSNIEENVAMFWITGFSFVCLICTLITLLTFISDIDRFNYPEKCIIFLSACYLMVSIGFLIRVHVGHENVACDILSQNDLINKDPLSDLLTLIRYENTGQISGNCLIIFWFIYYFSMSAAVWWVLLTFTWFLQAGLKWSIEAINSYSQYFHLIAWFLPAIKSIIIVSIGAVDGDPMTGICYVGNLNDTNLLIFVILPLCIYLIIGCLFLFSGFISLFRIRNVLRQQTRSKTDKLEKLMVRIVIFSVLYIVPSVIVTMCNIYEYQNRQNWALNHNCQCKSKTHIIEDNSGVKIKHFTNETPLYIVFLIKYIMCLVVGITSGFWIYSSKTLNSWIRFYGRLFCFYCFGLCKPEKKQINTEPTFEQRQNSVTAQLMSNISYNQQQSIHNSQLLSSNNQLMSSSSQFTNNSNRPYKQLLNQQQQQQFSAHLGLRSLSGSNNGSNSSHCKLPLNLSHV